MSVWYPTSYLLKNVWCFEITPNCGLSRRASCHSKGYDGINERPVLWPPEEPQLPAVLLALKALTARMALILLRLRGRVEPWLKTRTNRGHEGKWERGVTHSGWLLPLASHVLSGTHWLSIHSTTHRTMSPIPLIGAKSVPSASIRWPWKLRGNQQMPAFHRKMYKWKKKVSWL